MTKSPKQQLREDIRAAYNQSKVMARLRTGSPIDYLENTVMSLIDQYVAGVIGEDEIEKKDAKLYSGYSDKDYDIIKVPNKSAIQRNKIRAKLRKAAGL